MARFVAAIAVVLAVIGGVFFFDLQQVLDNPMPDVEVESADSPVPSPDGTDRTLELAWRR